MNLVDSCGWVEYFSDGEAAQWYAPAIESLGDLIVPTICQYEVYKRVLREGGEALAREAVALMRQGLVVSLDESIALAAARLSGVHNLPLADAIIFATTQMHNATVWTQDKHFANLRNVHFLS